MLVLLLALTPWTLSIMEETRVSAQSTISVNFSLNYGNGTAPTWFNGTLLPAGSTALNATIAKAQVDYSVHPQFGAFVNGINGVYNNPSTQLFWALWVFDREALTWRLSDVGASALILRDGDIFQWFYEYHGVFPPLSPGTTVLIFLNKYFIARGQTVTISGAISASAQAARNVTVQYSSDRGSSWNTLANIVAMNGTFAYEWPPPSSGDYQIRAVSGPFVSNVVSLGVSPCLIATAAYGSDMAPDVQFLREFRDNKVEATFLGRNFMDVFHAWYYSFSPVLAREISQRDALKAVSRVLLYPLIFVLKVSATIFEGFHVIPELAVSAAGLFASFSLGSIYVAPLMLLLRAKRGLYARIGNAASLTAMLLVISLVGLFASAALSSVLLAHLFSSLVVIAGLSLGALLTSNGVHRALTRASVS